MATEEIADHMQAAVKSIGPFQLSAQTITGASDGYLFLNVDGGYAEIVDLHDRLHTGILKKFHHPQMTYRPHITVGRILDKNQFEFAVREYLHFQNTFQTIVGEVILEMINPQDESNIERKILL